MITTAISLLMMSALGGTAPAEDAIAAYLGHDTFVTALLALPSDQPQAWSLDIPIAGRVERVDLIKHSLRSPDFKLLVDRGAGVIEQVEAPPVSTYRGTIQGWPSAVVALTLTPTGAKGLVWDAGSSWTIEPLNAVVESAVSGQHLIAPVLTSPFDEANCGTLHASGYQPGSPGAAAGPNGSPTCLTIADISYDCDVECYQQFGSDVAATLADIEAVTAGMDVPYQAEIFTTHRIGTVIVRTAEPDPYTTTDSGLLLDEFVDEWNTTQATVVRDIVHLATGKELDSNIIGLAYVGTLCPNGFEYGLTQWNLSFAGRISVVAHEVGHNWSAPHCLDPNYGGIMCGGTILSFGPVTQAQIIGFRNTRGCVDTPPPVITQLFPTSTIPALTPGTAESIGIIGDCFTSASVLSIDGVSLDDIAETYSVQNDNFISFEMPLVSSLGAIAVDVDDPNGSASTTATVVPLTSPLHQVGAGDLINVVYTASGAPFVLAGEPGDLQLLVYSLSNVPSVAPSISLALGNNFLEVQLGGVYVIDSPGWTAFTQPISGVSFTTFYSQTVRITGGSPFSASNLQEVFVLF